jgi:hypothetical protein
MKNNGNNENNNGKNENNFSKNKNNIGKNENKSGKNENNFGKYEKIENKLKENNENKIGRNESSLKEKEDEKLLEELNDKEEKASVVGTKKFVSTFGTQNSAAENETKTEKPSTTTISKPKKLANIWKNSTQQTTKSFSVYDPKKEGYNLKSNYYDIDNSTDNKVLQNQKNKANPTDFDQDTDSNLTEKYVRKNGKQIQTKNERVDDKTKTLAKNSISSKKESSEIQEEQENLKPFVEELYFLNKSEIVFNEDDIGPPLEDSEIKLLPEEEKDYLAQRQKMDEEVKDKSHYQKLIPIFSMGSSRKGPKNRAALTNPGSKWGNCQVPYSIGNSYSKQERAVIKGAMSQFAKETGINWVPRQQGAKDFVNIQRGSTCESMVGRTGGAQRMSLGERYIERY